MSDITPHPCSAIIKGGLRSIATSIPVLASLGQAWNEYETNRTTKRIEELLENLRKELEGLKETFGKHEVNLQGFPELLEITVEKIRKEFMESKRAKYARLLARLTIAGNDRPYDEKVALIESIDILSELDLDVLQLFKGKSEWAVKALDWKRLDLSGDDNQKTWQLACSLSRLESRGLIVTLFTHTGVVNVTDNFNQAAARWRERKYRVLPLGESLIKELFD